MEPENASEEMPPTGSRSSLSVWALFLFVWLLVVFAFSGQLVLSTGANWTYALRFALRDWLPWAILTPIVAWLGTRFPLERERLQWSIPIHSLACIAAVLFVQVFAAPFVPGERDRPLPPPSERLPLHMQRAPSRPETPPLPDRAESSVPPPPPRSPVLRHLLSPELIVRRAQFNIPVYWIVVSVAHALRYYRRFKERELRTRQLEASLTAARLESLRMQLQPHFLFNTLNAISTLVHRSPSAADEMIVNLSELLRAALESSGNEEIPLRSELELSSRYLQIQRVRFGERLSVSEAIADEAMDALVPPMILQPLLENALRHGVEPNSEPGYVSTAAAVENGMTVITITNSVPPASYKPVRAARGIGLANTRARLKTMYGERAVFALEVVPGVQCTAKVQIPFKSARTNATQVRRQPASP